MSAAECKVCSHPDRAAIEAAITGGLSNTQAGIRWGMSKDSVRRHKDAHLSPALRAVAAGRESAGAVKALDRLEALYAKASRVLDAAEAEGKASLSLAAIRELRGIVELLARVTGELDERPTVQVLNVAATPEWDALRGLVLAALRPYPDAGRAVALALTEAMPGE